MRRQPAQFPQEGLGFFGARSVLRAVRWRRCPKGKFRKLFQSRLGYWEVKGAINAQRFYTLRVWI